MSVPKIELEAWNVGVGIGVAIGVGIEMSTDIGLDSDIDPDEYKHMLHILFMQLGAPPAHGELSRNTMVRILDLVPDVDLAQKALTPVQSPRAAR